VLDYHFAPQIELITLPILAVQMWWAKLAHPAVPILYIDWYKISLMEATLPCSIYCFEIHKGNEAVEARLR
jgi:hypothetical protein